MEQQTILPERQTEVSIICGAITLEMLRELYK